jgi:hypothetical protein
MYANKLVSGMFLERWKTACETRLARAPWNEAEYSAFHAFSKIEVEPQAKRVLEVVYLTA